MGNARLKLKTSQWVLIVVYLLVAMNVEIFKVFGDSLFMGNGNRYVLITILFSAFFAFLVIFSGSKISAYIWLIALPIVLRVIIAIFSANEPGYRRYDLVQQYNGYFLVLFAVPIYYVLKYRATSVREFIRVLFVLTFVSMILKSFVSIFNYFTDIIIFPTFVYRDDWYRYGLLRMQAPVISNLAIPMGVFLMDTEKKRSKRKKYALMTLLVIVFSALIYASRFTAIWQTVVLLYIVMIKRKSKAKSVIYFSILVGLVFLLLQTGVIDTVLGSFSVRNQEMGGNTIVRLVALNYFSKQIRMHPLWGNGIWLHGRTEALNITMRGYTMGDLSDIGILYSIVQFGLVILIPVAILLIRLFMVGKKARKMGYEPYCILLWGSALCLLLGNLAIDSFAFFAMSVPIALAVAEYCDYELSRIMNSRREVSESIVEQGEKAK